MNSTLIAVEGPLKGTLLVLDRPEVFVGRERSNTLSIDDASVSRRHFSIVRQGEKFTLRDLSSHNGTYLNGKAVREAVLTVGDRIQVGKTVLLFAPADEHVDATAELDQTQAHHTSTTRLSATGSSYLNEQVDESSPQVARDLKTLIDISAAMQQAQTVDQLGRRLLELTLHAIPAARAALLVTAPAGGLEATIGFHRDPLCGEPVRVHPAVAEQVQSERISVVVDRSSSETDPGPACAIAAPLISGDQVHGVLYAETDDPAYRFGESHLQLVTAAGAIAGMALANLRRLLALYEENQRLQAEIRVRHDMIGDSRPMQEVYRQIERAAPTDATVLIFGESGTGKELVARAIHRNSPRSEKPFIALNCAAVSDTLLESELFGHERGAFTGALAMRKGRFEQADGGTLFLDEIGEMAPLLQAKLLRVLQEREFERVGGNKTIRVDVRLIAATNADLKLAIESGKFRQDLYYRLKVIGIRTPSLRERRQDIPMLAEYFLRHYAEKSGRRVTRFSHTALTWMREYDWPGNVRELQHAVEQAVILGATGTIELDELRETVIDSPDTGEIQVSGGYHEAVEAARRQVIRNALKLAGGVYSEAAKILGIHPVHLHRLAKEFHLKGEKEGAAGG